MGLHSSDSWPSVVTEELVLLLVCSSFDSTAPVDCDVHVVVVEAMGVVVGVAGCCVVDEAAFFSPCSSIK